MLFSAVCCPSQLPTGSCVKVLRTPCLPTGHDLREKDDAVDFDGPRLPIPFVDLSVCAHQMGEEVYRMLVSRLHTLEFRLVGTKINGGNEASCKYPGVHMRKYQSLTLDC